MASLASMMAAFVPAITRFRRHATTQISLAACRGDRVAIAMWRKRHDDWCAGVLQVKSLVRPRTEEERSALAEELERLLAMAKRWEKI